MDIFSLKAQGATAPDAVQSVADGDVVIALSDDRYLIVDSFENNPGGVSKVALVDKDGEELVCWVSDEWADDPELVMGAIFGTILGNAHA